MPNAEPEYIEGHDEKEGYVHLGAGLKDAAEVTKKSKFPGVRIEYSNIKQGYFNPFTNTINMPSSYLTNKNDIKYLHDYLMHEYGHFIQLKILEANLDRGDAIRAFTLFVLIPSIITAKSPNHMNEVCERNAYISYMNDTNFNTVKTCISLNDALEPFESIWLYNGKMISRNDFTYEHNKYVMDISLCTLEEAQNAGACKLEDYPLFSFCKGCNNQFMFNFRINREDNIPIWLDRNFWYK